MKRTVSGFTIVELLIVIVVIAILAAISIVAYNGIQERARLSTAKSDLSNLTKQVELFMVDDGAPPNTQPEWAQVLRNAKLFDDTRSGSEGRKSFMFCWNATEYAIVAAKPIGITPTFWYVKDGSIQSDDWDDSVEGVFGIDKGCAQPSVLPDHTNRVWSNQVP